MNPLDAFIVLFFITMIMTEFAVIIFAIIQLKRDKLNEQESK